MGGNSWERQSLFGSLGLFVNFPSGFYSGVVSVFALRFLIT
jgi:hypothetical protein